MALTDGLISYYNLDDLTNTIVDSTGNNNGINSGATLGSTGIINTCLDFDTSTDYVDLGYGVLITNEQSISLWINSSETPDSRRFLVGNRSTLLELANSTSIRFFPSVISGATFSVTIPIITALTGWIHIVVTENSSNIVKIYLNGTLVGSGEAGPLNGNSMSSRLADYVGIAGKHFQGKMDEVGIWNKELSSSEVQQIYNNSFGLTYPFEVLPPPITEGFLEVMGITAPTEAHEGDLINFTFNTKNTGATDNFRVELSGDLTDSQEFSLGVGLTKEVPFSFTMPNYDPSITINTYHLTEEGDWVWDVSSVWDVNRWN